MNNTTIIILFAALACLTLVLLVTTIILHKRVSTLLQGEHGRSLEKILHDLIDHVRTVSTVQNEEKEKLSLLIKETLLHVKTPQMIRYKALESNNSNQSFSIALLDSHGAGSVITSLHIRDRVSIYAKKIHSWKSDLELTEEEQKAVALVKDSVKEK